jgi:hypothetical protein
MFLGKSIMFCGRPIRKGMIILWILTILNIVVMPHQAADFVTGISRNKMSE